ncbi:MAG: hypothetical protein RLZZ283_777 [Candidatus Parcubacteria bacterium]|jgi:hypothetical protein
MKIFVAHSSNFDFNKKLYEPLRASALNTAHTFIFPHSQGDEYVTREVIKSCDALIAEVSLPSTGMGIELGWADAFKVPILCIHESGAKFSSSVLHVAKEVIAYDGSHDMVRKIQQHITGLIG